MPIAQGIRDYLECIRFTRPQYHMHTEALVDCLNWATSPSRLMTDREHKACRRLARFCRDRLATRVGWKETEDGRLVTI